LGFFRRLIQPRARSGAGGAAGRLSVGAHHLMETHVSCHSERKT
jgi:hypothetical protein